MTLKWIPISGLMTLVFCSVSAPPAEAGTTGKGKVASAPKKSEPIRTREIYSAMEPEPGPGAKLPKKQTLKNLDQFDAVPAAQREPITRRLRLIEKLLLEHGRAYDYRSVTIAELNAILSHLDSPQGRVRGADPKPESDDGTQTDLNHQEPKKRIQLPSLTENRPEAPPEEETEPSAEEGEAPLPPPPTKKKEEAQVEH